MDDCDCCIGVALDHVADKRRPHDMTTKKFDSDNCLAVVTVEIKERGVYQGWTACPPRSRLQLFLCIPTLVIYFVETHSCLTVRFNAL